MYERKVNFKNLPTSVIQDEDAERLFGWFNGVVSKDENLDKTFLDGLKTYIINNDIDVVRAMPAVRYTNKPVLLIPQATNSTIEIFTHYVDGTLTPYECYLEDVMMDASHVGVIQANKVYMVYFEDNKALIYSISRTLGDITDYSAISKIINWGVMQKGRLRQDMIIVPEDKYLHVTVSGSFRTIMYVTFKDDYALSRAVIIINEVGKYSLLLNDKDVIDGLPTGYAGDMCFSFKSECEINYVIYDEDSNSPALIEILDSNETNELAPTISLNNLVGRLYEDGTILPITNNNLYTPMMMYLNLRIFDVLTNDTLVYDFGYGMKFTNGTITITGPEGVDTLFKGCYIENYNSNVSLSPIVVKYNDLKDRNLNDRRHVDDTSYVRAIGLNSNSTDGSPVTLKDTPLTGGGLVGASADWFNQINVEKGPGDIPGALTGIHSANKFFLVGYKNDNVDEHVTFSTSGYTNIANPKPTNTPSFTSEDMVFSKSGDDFRYGKINIDPFISRGHDNPKKNIIGTVPYTDNKVRFTDRYVILENNYAVGPVPDLPTVCYAFISTGIVYGRHDGTSFKVYYRHGSLTTTICTLTNVSTKAFQIVVDEPIILTMPNIYITVIQFFDYGSEFTSRIYVVRRDGSVIDLDDTKTHALDPYLSMRGISFFPTTEGFAWLYKEREPVITIYDRYRLKRTIKLPNNATNIQKNTEGTYYAIDEYFNVWGCKPGDVPGTVKFLGCVLKTRPFINGFYYREYRTGLVGGDLETGVSGDYSTDNMGPHIDIFTSFTTTDIEDDKFHSMDNIILT